jgi:hypothetical protein
MFRARMTIVNSTRSMMCPMKPAYTTHTLCRPKKMTLCLVERGQFFHSLNTFSICIYIYLIPTFWVAILPIEQNDL